jgi:type 1 glutamine amidotransferase
MHTCFFTMELETIMKTIFMYLCGIVIATAFFKGENLQAKPRETGLKKVFEFANGGPVGHPVKSADTMLQKLAKKYGFQLVVKDSAALINLPNLLQYDVVVFNNTSRAGTVLNAAQQSALREYVLNNNGGFVSFHGGSATNGTWPWYTDTFIPGQLAGHGGVVPGMVYKNKTLQRNDTFAVFFRNVPDTFTTTEEWYKHTPEPRKNPNVPMLYYTD